MVLKPQKLPKFYTTVRADCAMKLITEKVINFISDRISGNYDIIDLTWFDQYDESIKNLKGDFVLAVDVADPPYFLPEKLAWMKGLSKPVYYVGPIIKNFPYPIIPFFGWLRFRFQNITNKVKHENFFVSFNRKPHKHRQIYFNEISNHPDLISKGYCSFFEIQPKHELAQLTLDNNIFKLQSLAQEIDEKQLYSSFEIVCETSATNYHVFLTEKFNKCISSETPLLLIGDYNTLTTLKTYYGFHDFGPDDSYDREPDYSTRLSKVLSVAKNFFNLPLQKTFDNAKRNAEHLHEKFDDIHDGYVERAILCIK